jgi:hypothetical protein
VTNLAENELNAISSQQALIVQRQAEEASVQDWSETRQSGDAENEDQYYNQCSFERIVICIVAILLDHTTAQTGGPGRLLPAT